MTPEKACEIVDRNPLSASIWATVARTLRQALAEAQSANLALTESHLDIVEKAQAERDAALAKLDKTTRVVEAARALSDAHARISTQTQQRLDELREALAALAHTGA